MGLKWTDTLDIAIALDEVHADVDPRYVNFVDLRVWVLELPEFDDDPRTPAKRSSRLSRWRGWKSGSEEVAPADGSMPGTKTGTRVLALFPG